MSNFYLKNRLLLQLLFVFLLLFFIFNISNNIADGIEPSNIVSSQENQDFKIININIPQGASASQISAILDSSGVINSQLAFEL